MRITLAILILTFGAVLSLAQDTIYWPEHEGMTGARWSPDGEFIATWGESPLVRIWNDHDGSLALELDHSPLTFELPNGKLPDMFAKLAVVGMGWSEDMRYISTFVKPDHRRYEFFQSVWISDSEEFLYSHYWGFYWDFLREYIAEHEVVEEKRIVAAWNQDVMSFINVDTASSSLGEELATIEFDARVVGVDTRWNDRRTEALVLLHPAQDNTCTDCNSTLELIDTDLESESFGKAKWRHSVPDEIRIFAWPNRDDLLAIHFDNRIELWDLNAASSDFGLNVLQIELEGEALHDLIYDEIGQRLIIPEVKETLIKHYERWHLPDCWNNECEFRISVWDVDATSEGFGARLYVVRTPHQWFVDIEGGAPDLNRVDLNLSQSQIHVYSATRKNPEKSREPVTHKIFAFDLRTGERVEARDIVLEESEWWYPFAPARPQLDTEFELMYTTEFPITELIALNPMETKLIATLTDGNTRQTSWHLVNIETGEYLFPDGQWRVPQSAG